jgi:hypothetical protein
MKVLLDCELIRHPDNGRREWLFAELYRHTETTGVLDSTFLGSVPYPTCYDF